MSLLNWLGFFAGACITLSFIPQIAKIRRQGGADVSFAMLFIYLIGSSLWLVYGFRIHSPEMIWANSAAIALVSLAMVMKATHPNRNTGTETSHENARAIATPPAPANPNANISRTATASGAAASAPIATIATNAIDATGAAGAPTSVAARYVDRDLGAGKVVHERKADGPRKLRVAVDMDEVIADAFGKMLRAYNQRTGRDISKEQIVREGIEVMFAPEFLTPEIKTALDELPHDRSFFADLELVEGAQESLRELSKDFEIFIASAAMDVPSSFDAKYQWLKQYFPFIPQSHYIFCGDKSILNADFLVDDRPRHFEHFRGQGILFTAPHNIHREAKVRANNWKDVVRILQEANAAQGALARR